MLPGNRAQAPRPDLGPPRARNDTRMTAHLEETNDQPRARRVLHVWYADYPWDVRVQKVILGLTRAGWIVDLVARNKANLRPIEIVDGATVHRLPRLRFLKSSVDSVLSFPAFVNPRWIIHIWRVARATRPDVILVRDLPLAPTVVLIARALRIPVAFDMAEDYPGFLRTRWQTNGIKPIDILVRNPWLASLVERWVLRNVDAVVCVIEESAQRVAAMGVPSEK